MSFDKSSNLSLAEELKQDNRALLRALAKANRGAKNADPVEFQQALQVLEKVLVEHLMKKATKVHSHLRQQAKAWGEFEAYENVTAHKAEITRIGDATLRFVKIQRSTPEHELDFAKIRTTLNTLGHLLGELLNREERQLLPLLNLYA